MTTKQETLKVKKNKRDVSYELELEVEASSSYADKAYSMSLRDVSNNVDVPGFRKGKAPKDVIEKQVGQGYITQKAFERVFYELLIQAAIQESIDIVDVIQIVSYELLPTKPLMFKVVVELKPEVKLGKYKGLKVKSKKVSYNKEQFIDKTLERIAANFIAYQKVSERGVKEGDLVVIDFEGKFDDGSEIPGGKAENFQALLEKDKFLPEFIEKLIDTNVGESKEIDVTFPESYTKELATKNAKFKVKLNEIQEKLLQPIDDSLAKKVGLTNLDELKVKIEGQMIEQQNNVNQKELENKIVDEVIQDSKFEISNRMIEKEADFLLGDIKAQCQKDGVNWENFKSDEKNKELLEKANEAGKKRISIDLVLGSIIKNENITASEEEIMAEINKQVQQMGDKYKYLLEDRKFRSNVEIVNLRNKAVDFLIKNNEPIWEDEVLALN